LCCLDLPNLSEIDKAKRWMSCFRFLVWSDQMTYRLIKERCFLLTRGIRSTLLKSETQLGPDHHGITSARPPAGLMRTAGGNNTRKVKEISFFLSPCLSFFLSIYICPSVSWHCPSHWTLLSLFVLVTTWCSCVSSEDLYWIPLIVWMQIWHFISSSAWRALHLSSLTVHLHTRFSCCPRLPSLWMIVYYLWVFN